MTVVELELVLPESLAQAAAAGLLTSEVIERLLREELRRQQVDALFDVADRLAALDNPPLTEADVQAEIQAVREARRSYRADSGGH